MNRLYVLLGVIFLLGVISGCGDSLRREIYTVPSPPVGTSWQHVKSAAQTVGFKTLVTGQVQVPVSGMLDRSDPKTETISEKSWIVDVYAHWIRHPKFGDFLIDSGLDRRFQSGGQGSLKGLIAPWIVEDSFQQAGEDIGNHIKQNKIELKGIFLSHIHGDHSSGIPALQKEIPIYIGPDEAFHDYPFIMYNDHFKNVKKVYELDFSKAVMMEPLGKALDIFGDGSLWAVHTPGHTAGHLSFLVLSENGWVLLTGDASHTRWGFENDVIPGWAEDDLQAKVSLKRIKQFAQENPFVRVIFGHDS